MGTVSVYPESPFGSLPCGAVDGPLDGNAQTRPDGPSNALLRIPALHVPDAWGRCPALLGVARLRGWHPTSLYGPGAVDPEAARLARGTAADGGSGGCAVR